MSDFITVTFEDKVLKFPKGTKYIDISKESKYKDSVLGVKVNNKITPLSVEVLKDESIEFFDCTSLIGTKMYKAAVMFIFEVALKTLYPSADINYLHSVPGGIFGEIKYQKVMTINDIARIKEEMNNIVKSDYRIFKYNILKKEAENFYETALTPEKALNLQTADNIVPIFKLKNYLNYYYVEMPYSTKSINLFDIKYLDNNSVIFLYPSYLTKGKMPEYIPHQNIIDSFHEGRAWLQRLQTPYVSDLNNLVSTYEIKGFIESCELKFNDQIKKACDEIIKNGKRFIMIAGPSSSGKTTTTRVLASYLRSIGYDPICLSTDDYFVERELTPKDNKGNYDFERLEAIDIELLNTQILSLLKGEEINVPSYNFITGHKEYHNHFIKLKNNSIILMEGLHTLNSALTPNIPDTYKYKIYLSPFIPLNIDRHNYISTLDLRLIRRIVRDSRTRGSTAADTIKSWQSVRNGEEKYIFPFIHEASVVINTALPYELGVLKVYADPLLLSIDTDSDYYEEARRLAKFLKSFYPISSEYVGTRSILREFIGGRND